MSKVGLDEFKSALDKWLESIPDQPKIDGLTHGTQDLSGVYSNSIIHQINEAREVGCCPNPGPRAGLYIALLHKTCPRSNFRA